MARAHIPRITPDDPNSSSRFGEFVGLVNTRSRKDIGVKGLYVADNIQVSDTRKVVRRDGFTLERSGSHRAVFGYYDNLYVVDGDALIHRAGDGTESVLRTGLVSPRYAAVEVNGDSYVVGTRDAFIVRGNSVREWRVEPPPAPLVELLDDGALPSTPLNIGAKYARATYRCFATYTHADGREGPPSDVTAIEGSPMATLLRATIAPAYDRTNIYLTEPDGSVFRKIVSTTQTVVTFAPYGGDERNDFVGMQPVPLGCTKVEFYAGRAYLGEYVREVDVSIVWMSQPLAFSVFDQAKDFMLLPGELCVMKRINQGMLLATTQRIWNYTPDGQLVELADYGCVPGEACATDSNSTGYFWTQRGVCKAMPFENLTENDVSVPAGVRVTSCLAQRQGQKQFLSFAAGGGTPFNARTERT